MYKKVQQLIVLTICYQKLKAEGYWTIDMEYNSNENVIIYCKDGHSNINSGIGYQYLEDIIQKKVIVLIDKH